MHHHQSDCYSSASSQYIHHFHRPNTLLYFHQTQNLQFESYREKEGRKITSSGVVYGDCVLIKQQEKIGNRDYYQMYSWDVPHKCYTYISFDKERPMSNCYDKLRRGQVNLHHEDISLKFAELGISFDDIAQVRLHQDMKSFTLDDMFKARVVSQDTDVSFTAKR